VWLYVYCVEYNHYGCTTVAHGSLWLYYLVLLKCKWNSVIRGARKAAVATKLTKPFNVESWSRGSELRWRVIISYSRVYCIVNVLAVAAVGYTAQFC